MEKIIPVDEGAEAFVEMLNANDVEYLFLNPGTDTFPIQEALSKFKSLGKRTPEVILSLHESVAMAAAHGHFMISGKPQVVLVHVDVGTQQIGGALHNAQRARIGVILCAGRTPSTYEQDIRGERSGGIHWWQEQFDQAGIVRGYVKWEYELRFAANINNVVQRAFQVASTEPPGPVYLTLPREILMEKIENMTVPDVARHGAAVTPQADADELDKLAEALLGAENPLIIAGDPGRNPESVPSLVELAETLGVRVASDMMRMNFPNTHPLAATGFAGQYIKDADVLLVIDSDIPYIPRSVKLKEDARIIHISIDPVKKDMPLWTFPGDAFIQADSAKALPALTGIIKRKITPEQQTSFRERAEELGAEHKKARESMSADVLSKADQKPMASAWVGHCLNEVIDEDTIIVHEMAIAPLRHVRRTKPGTLYGSGGSSLGFGLGGALGAKLAAKDKTIVSLMGDGCFIFGCPIPTFWAADLYKAPFLAIILNNQEYHAPRGGLRGGYGEQSYSERTGVWVGMDIPSPNYAMIAEACGAYGQTVEEPAQLKAAMEAALERVRNGQAALIDVRLEHPYP